MCDTHSWKKLSATSTHNGKAIKVIAIRLDGKICSVNAKFNISQTDEEITKDVINIFNILEEFRNPPKEASKINVTNLEGEKQNAGRN